MKVAEEFEKQLKGTDFAKVECHVKKTGCNGFCENGPLVTIMPDNIAYYHVKPEDVKEILEKSVKANDVVERLLYKGNDGKPVKTRDDNPFYKPQKKIALRNIGVINPENGEWNSHVKLGIWADLYVIAPATANSMAKIACGIADNLLLTTCLSARCKIMLAPAMDLDMYQNPMTQRNIQILKNQGFIFVDAKEGELATVFSFLF